MSSLTSSTAIQIDESPLWTPKRWYDRITCNPNINLNKYTMHDRYQYEKWLKLRTLQELCEIGPFGSEFQSYHFCTIKVLKAMGTVYQKDLTNEEKTIHMKRCQDLLLNLDEIQQLEEAGASLHYHDLQIAQKLAKIIVDSMDFKRLFE